MVCYALGRCRICARKHKLPIFGGQENQHILIERIQLELIVLNTVCVECIERLETIIKITNNSVTEPRSCEVKVDTTGYSRTNEIRPEVDEHCKEVNEQIRLTESIHEETFDSKENMFSIEETTERLAEDQRSTLEFNKLTSFNDPSYPKELANIEGKKTVRGKIYCDFCSKEFTHSGDLKRHKRKHTGERPYECPDCLKTFSQLSNLSRHRRVHSGERPFVCGQCGRSYSRKGRLLSHIDRDRCQQTKKSYERLPISIPPGNRTSINN